MNLRPTADRTGFPPRDDTPASILTENGHLEGLYHIQCCAFFSAIFELVSKVLPEQPSQDNDNAIALVWQWNRDMSRLDSQQRATFFAQLESTYRKVSLMEQIHRPLLIDCLVDFLRDAHT